MEEYINAFIDFIRVERNYSDYTENSYLIDIENYDAYLKRKHLNFKKITYKEISTYAKYLKEESKLQPASINRHLSSLRTFYNYLIRKKVIETNPFKLVKGPKKANKLPNYMKYNEFESMIEACGESILGIRNKSLLETLLATGARIGELVNIKIEDINFSNHEILLLGKGNKERICYFGEHCSASLQKYLKDARPELTKKKSHNYVFVNHLGNPITARGISTILDSIIKKSAVKTKITPHTFRHTFATMLLNEGCDLKSVQELLGHVNLSTTSIYTHVTNDRIKDIYLHTHPRNKS